MGRRAKAIDRIERRIATLENRPGLCLYYAHHTVSVLWQAGYKAVIQAGSFSWPRMLREHDDGIVDTHFSYEWSPHDPASALSVAFGNLPEIHVWVGLVEEQEIVDFTTRHIKAAAVAMNLPWTNSAPPRYLWTPTQQLPDWVSYRPDPQATIYACTLLKRLFNPAYLKR
jgi:hypothetical protein